MKNKLYRLFFLFALIGLASCSEPPSTYTVKNNTTDHEGLTIDLVAFEYNEAGEKIGSNAMDDVKKGFSETFTAKDATVKVKLYYTMSYLSESESKWVQQVFYLTEGDNIIIELKNETMIGPSEP